MQVPDLGLHDYVLAGDMDAGTTIKFIAEAAPAIQGVGAKGLCSSVPINVACLFSC